MGDTQIRNLKLDTTYIGRWILIQNALFLCYFIRPKMYENETVAGPYFSKILVIHLNVSDLGPPIGSFYIYDIILEVHICYNGDKFVVLFDG